MPTIRLYEDRVYKSYQPYHRVTSLDGFWDFVFLGDQNPDTVDVATLEFNDRLPVPGCFDAMPAYTGKRGLAAYSTRLNIPYNATHRLVFNGVNHWCRIFVNGVHLGDHVGGFTRFEVDLPATLSGDFRQVDLIVLVSNVFDYERCPLHLEYFDWYQYGGIPRSVELHHLPVEFIESCRITTLDYKLRRVQLNIIYRYLIDAPLWTSVIIHLDNRFFLKEGVELQKGVGTLRFTFDLPDAALWSPDDPQLHLFEVRLYSNHPHEHEPIRIRYGIRQIEVSGQQLLINGEPIRLVGCNRHEFHPHFGHALPDALLTSDLQQLRDLGCNFIRGSHYPQDESFLDLCDEFGICVWCEGIGWQHTAEHLTDEGFIQAQLNHLTEMVTMAIHHPSVIMWGILNESRSDLPESVPTYERLLTHLRTLDSSRPVTYASNHPFDDRCLHLVDIVSINTYPGWYFGSLETIPAELDKIAAQLDAAGYASKPLIISEIGAGAIPGWRDAYEVRWTEQYQAALLETVIHHLFVVRDRFVGLAIWLFNDFRTPNETAAVLGRPRGFNDKGLVDEYRRPKLSYHRVKAAFTRLKR